MNEFEKETSNFSLYIGLLYLPVLQFCVAVRGFVYFLHSGLGYQNNFSLYISWTLFILVWLGLVVALDCLPARLWCA